MNARSRAGIVRRFDPDDLIQIGFPPPDRAMLHRGDRYGRIRHSSRNRTMSKNHYLDTEELVTDAKVVLEDVEAMLDEAAGATGERAQALRTRASEALGRAKQRLHDAQTAVANNTRAAARATDDFVHENPWGAVGVAAGIGFLVGLLVSRR
jgi:ElaB/YqjD/DUF883 family membrane-anchored ribosome-binding protein